MVLVPAGPPTRHPLRPADGRRWDVRAATELPVAMRTTVRVDVLACA